MLRQRSIAERLLATNGDLQQAVKEEPD